MKHRVILQATPERIHFSELLAASNKCLASSNKCLASNKKCLASSNKCLTSSNKKLLSHLTCQAHLATISRQKAHGRQQPGTVVFYGGQVFLVFGPLPNQDGAKSVFATKKCPKNIQELHPQRPKPL